MNKWMTLAEIGDDTRYPLITDEEAGGALIDSTAQVLRNLPQFTDRFPGAASFDNRYVPGENRNWTTGFWTGEIWLAYETALRESGKPSGIFGEAEAAQLKHAGQLQVGSFLKRIRDKYEVDHHDMGFLYSPSCVAAWKLLGDRDGREAAILAADQLLTRFQPTGGFLQAWGSMGEPGNYRFIIDCLLNLPLLYWASGETGDSKYRDIAEKHIHTAMANVIREDDSTWHTVFMNMETGEFDHGATCQGYKDGSSWARGQAWGVYGTAVAYKYTGEAQYIGYFRRVADYFMSHLPEDLVPFWDLTFGNGDEKTEPRDSSSAVIAACGMLEMARSLSAEESSRYIRYAGKLLKAVYGTDEIQSVYRVTDPGRSNGQLLHGTYSKKSPYNTCTPEGVDECVIWGDYYWMEALTRLIDRSWNIYW